MESCGDMNGFKYEEIIDNTGRNALAVDILPVKTCNLDCVFCPLGRTANKTCQQMHFGNVTEEALLEMKSRIRELEPEIVILLSKGEAAYNDEFGKVIAAVHDTYTPVQLFSNGYSLNVPEIRRFANKCEEVVGELRCTNEEQFRKLQRPVDSSITFGDYILNMKEFREQYPGKFILEITALPGFNDDRESVQRMKLLLKFLHPAAVSVVPARNSDGSMMPVFGMPEEKFEEVMEKVRRDLSRYVAVYG